MTSHLERFHNRFGRLPTEIDPDYLEMLRMSKYRILAVPDVSQARCANCGSSKNDGRKYVDFGLTVDWYGVVFLCSHCLKDVATALGLFDKLQRELDEALVDKPKDLIEVQKEGHELYDRVVQTFKEFEDFYVGIYSHRSDIGSDGSVSVGIEKTTSESSPNRSESGTIKSTTGTGREDLRSLAELLNNGI